MSFYNYLTISGVQIFDNHKKASEKYGYFTRIDFLIFLFLLFKEMQNIV